MPIVKLLPETAHSYYNLLLNKHEMVFDVLMWSDSARKAIFAHLLKEGHVGPNSEGIDSKHSMEDIIKNTLNKAKHHISVYFIFCVLYAVFCKNALVA